jgi:hypothetical protein
LLFAAVLASAVVGHARAQAQEPVIDAEDRRGAAAAYDRASAAYLSRNYEQAAEYFEVADRLAPSAAALVQAVRSHQRAGNELRAASLALRLAARYPNDRQAQSVASRVLDGAGERYVRVDVECDGCAVLVDGAVLDHPSFFVEPGEEHRITAHFETGDVEETVQGDAGETRAISLDAPAPTGPPVPSDEPAPTGPPSAVDPPEVDDGGGLPPVAAVIAGVLTLGAAGVATWSGLDALAGVDGYEADPTQDALERGQARERRTNILIGVAAGLAAVTIALALLTDWDGEEESDASLRASVAIVPGGGAAVVGGALP